jgi:hypothetical protein
LQTDHQHRLGRQGDGQLAVRDQILGELCEDSLVIDRTGFAGVDRPAIIGRCWSRAILPTPTTAIRI